MKQDPKKHSEEREAEADAEEEGIKEVSEKDAPGGSG